MYKSIKEKYIHPIFETDTDFTEWFGYYNYDVISRDGKKMLCNRAKFDARAVSSEDTIDLGYYDIETGEWYYIDTSDSFNWQQGAMLQWMPGEENENKVIYNKSKNNHFISIIYDIETGEKKEISFPTYCVTPDGKFSISLNYERSYWCRAYHYQSVKNPDYDVQVASDDGIFKVDLTKNTVERIIDIHDVIALDAPADFKAAKHWFEHIMINPSGTQFVFLHRFSYGTGYFTRMCMADIDGNNLQIIPGWKMNDWSHFGWKGDDSFAIYTVKKSAVEAAYIKSSVKVPATSAKRSISSIARQIIHKCVPQFIKDSLRGNENNYQVFSSIDGKYTLVGKYDDKLFNIDGHPSFTADGKYMITDSYPDSDGNQRLLVMNTENKKVVQIASFEAPLRGNPASCDLHPKLSFGGKYLAVDTAYTGKHRMILFELNWGVIENSLS